MNLAPLRMSFIWACLELLGHLYRWAAKGPDRFDCSGLVSYALKVASGGRIDWCLSHNAQRYWDELEPTDNPKPGDLCFYGHGSDGISHVMVLLWGGHVIGATGGGSDVTSDPVAEQRGAMVTFKKPVQYRPDFRGYRRLPEYPPTA